MTLTLHRTLAAGLCLAAVAAAPLAAQVSVGGVVYAQYQYQLAKDTLKADSNIQHINNFDITRAYINVTGRFAGGVATRVTADIFTNSNIPGSRAYRIKYAYVTWTPEGSALTYPNGEIHTPWLDWEEALWDYRMQGQMAMERGGYMSSSDFGAGVDGKWNSDQFNFQVGVYNGENYSGALGDQSKDFMARASYRLLATDDGSRIGGLRLTGYAGLGTPSSGGTRNRFIGMISYRSMDLTLAAQYASTTDTTTGGNTTTAGGATGAVGKKTGSVISAYGVFHFPSTRFSVLGRVDITDPNTCSPATPAVAACPASAGTDKQTRIIAGASYQLSPNLRLLADVDLLSYQSGFAPSAGNYDSYANRQSAFFQAMFTF
jgi:hypothetical protein